MSQATEIYTSAKHWEDLGLSPVGAAGGNGEGGVVRVADRMETNYTLCLPCACKVY